MMISNFEFVKENAGAE